ncbi:uncharacterized protein LOC131007789 [Salvia miltiorrhiza]|uniref:uncharacterized protein LOC131007789 n=1 Tax=Salvia miltiorrhiza TaxID=226208 RepID=UPI0025AC1723|nr:uncharacterized protein LOC131007789 [Salvia miltiorrhiza]
MSSDEHFTENNDSNNDPDNPIQESGNEKVAGDNEDQNSTPTGNAAITQAWKKYHKTDRNEQLNPDVEGVIPVEDLYGLSKYVTSDLPGWGKYKPWYDYDELIMVCELESHWVTFSVNFIKSAITIYDSTQRKLDDTDYAVRKTFFTPLARMLPQILKYSGFYDERKEVKPKLTEWRFAYLESGNVYKQTDTKSGGAYALKYAEMILTKQHLPSFEKKDVEKLCVDVAATIYKFSTEGESED